MSNPSTKPKEKETAAAITATSDAAEAPLWSRIQLTANRRKWNIAVGTLFAVTVVTAIAHGVFANRWAQRSGLAEIGAAVSDFPEIDLPNWEFVDKVEISGGVVQMLKSTGQMHQRYRLKRSGQMPAVDLQVAVFVGSPGRITAHDPQVCYSAIEYSGLGSRRKISFADHGEDQKEHEFWTMSVTHEDQPRQALIVSHAWGWDGTCSAAEWPRVAYLGQPYLYKVQIAMNAKPGENLEENHSVEFLKEFLPELRKAIQQAR